MTLYNLLIMIQIKWREVFGPCRGMNSLHDPMTDKNKNKNKNRHRPER